MAFYGKCAWCGSMDIQPTVDEYQCLECGQQTKADGAKSPPAPQFYVPMKFYADPDAVLPENDPDPGHMIPQRVTFSHEEVRSPRLEE